MAEHVSDTSPLLYLHQAGLLDLLPLMYGGISIPAEVRSELQEGRRRGFNVPDPDALPWVRVRSVPLNAQVVPFELDGGEAAALSLALASGDGMILLDDGPARRAAHALGLHVVGTIGVIVAAKKIGLVPTVRPILDKFVELGFRIAPALKRAMLAAADE